MNEQFDIQQRPSDYVRSIIRCAYSTTCEWRIVERSSRALESRGGGPRNEKLHVEITSWDRHSNYERGWKRGRGLGQWNLIVGRTQTSPRRASGSFAWATIVLRYGQTKECLYAALYTPLASKGLPRSVGTLDCNPTTVGLGPRLGSPHTETRQRPHTRAHVCTVRRLYTYDC